MINEYRDSLDWYKKASVKEHYLFFGDRSHSELPEEDLEKFLLYLEPNIHHLYAAPQRLVMSSAVSIAAMILRVRIGKNLVVTDRTIDILRLAENIEKSIKNNVPKELFSTIKDLEMMADAVDRTKNNEESKK